MGEIIREDDRLQFEMLIRIELKEGTRGDNNKEYLWLLLRSEYIFVKPETIKEMERDW